MLRKIQKYLLINHPLLWNIKIISLTAFSITFHIIFFLIGYSRGSLNFTETDNNYSYDTAEGTIIFFSVLVSILFLIIWAVYYFKNNALKSFYPKNNFSLFKEWFLTLIASLLISTFLVSYFYGKETKIRSYYSETEARKRCETLALGSFFVNGSYAYYYDGQETVEAYQESNITIDTLGADSVKTHFIYKGKKYSVSSLLNKNLNAYSFFDAKKDSLLKERIKNLLVNNQKDSIRTLLKNYLAIAKQHNLKASINEDQWLNLTYDYPKFEKYKTIGSEEKDVYYLEDNEYSRTQIDTTEQYLVKEKDGNQFLYNKFYVPEKQLHYSYTKISDSYENPNINWATFLISLYVAFAISLLVFSFRVTSGKNWLIALVSLGVLNIIIGIITAISGSEYVYLTAILLVFLALFTYFLYVTSTKKSKGISGITINAMLWILPAFAPIIYYLLLAIAREISGYNDYRRFSKDLLFPKITYFQDNETILNFTYINLLVIAIIMLFLSRKIKQWRGIPEN